MCCPGISAHIIDKHSAHIQVFLQRFQDTYLSYISEEQG